MARISSQRWYDRVRFLRLVALWLKPFAVPVQIVALIVAAALAIAQLRAGNEQAKVSNTLAFMQNMQSSDFYADYLESLEWLKKRVQPSSTTDEEALEQCEETPQQVDQQITRVLVLFDHIGHYYEKRVLDRGTIEATWGVQIAQFWLMARYGLYPSERPGFEGLDRFVDALKRSVPSICSQLEEMENVLKMRRGIQFKGIFQRIKLQGVVRIQRNKTKLATKVFVEEGAKVPNELLALLPSQDTRKLNKSEIRELADKHRLLDEWKVNPQLKFMDGDISLFYNESLSARNVELQFMARRIVLEKAEEEGTTIPSQGDLSALSQPVFSWLHSAARGKPKPERP